MTDRTPNPNAPIGPLLKTNVSGDDSPDEYPDSDVDRIIAAWDDGENRSLTAPLQSSIDSDNESFVTALEYQHKPDQKETDRSEDDLPPSSLPPNTYRMTIVQFLKLPSAGTYGNRETEKRRLEINPVNDKFESEHIVGFSALYQGIAGLPKWAKKRMPAYYEDKDLHQSHVGSGLGRDHYRLDQQSLLLLDDVARSEGAVVSNAYQINQIDYGSMLRSRGLQRSNGSRGEKLRIVTNSYNNTVSHDPPVVTDIGREAVTFQRLGPRGQAEAHLAREAACSGEWPTAERQEEVKAHYLEKFFGDQSKLDAETRAAKQAGAKMPKKVSVNVAAKATQVVDEVAASFRGLRIRSRAKDRETSR